MNATAVESPALRASVAIWRPGCTADLRSPTCGARRAASGERGEVLDDHDQPPESRRTGRLLGGLHQLQDRRTEAAEPLPDGARLADPAGRQPDLIERGGSAVATSKPSACQRAGGSAIRSSPREGRGGGMSPAGYP